MNWLRPAAAVALITVVAACGGSSKPSHKVVSAIGDVRIASCQISSGGLPVAVVAITNGTSYRADFTTSVAFTTGGVTHSAPGFEGGLAPGKTARADVVGPAPSTPAAGVTCKITSVGRTPSEVITPTT